MARTQCLFSRAMRHATCREDRSRIGWPLIRFGTDDTLKFSAAASQYLLAIGALRRVMRSREG
jgi:hypothetical protein